jgi:hypothetical protein
MESKGENKDETPTSKREHSFRRIQGTGTHKTEIHWVDQEVDRDLGMIESFHPTSPDLELQPIAIYMMHAGYERKYTTAHRTPYNFFSMANRRCIYSRGMPSYSE